MHEGRSIFKNAQQLVKFVAMNFPFTVQKNHSFPFIIPLSLEIKKLYNFFQFRMSPEESVN